jgi:uncharacterized protein HemX
MDDTRRTEPATAIGRGVLQAIFTVFLGLMITAVVGVGVYTFHPNPAADTQEQVQALYQERERLQGCASIQGCVPLEQLSEAERAELDAIDAQVLELQQAADAQREAWSQSTSVILIVIATALMAVALLLGDSVTVLSNGILLGGLFTMLYGVGWGLASGNSLTRFLVLVAALAVSLGLGYLKFVRPRRELAPETTAAGAPATAGTAIDAPSEQLAALAARVADLERRLAAAAAGLGDAGDPAR